MALDKCRECNNEISTNAEKCPHCGAKKKKSKLPVLIGLLIAVLFIYGANQNPTNTGIKRGQQLTAPRAENEQLVKEKKEPSKPAWTTTTSKDEMTGKFSAYAQSPRVPSTKKMSFPYRDVYSWMGVGCDNKNQWVYFGFSESPNLINDKTKSGYNLISTRIKWNSTVEDVYLTQTWGEQFLNLRKDSSTLVKVAGSNSVLLELQWYKQGKTYFEYPLHGSSKALKDILKMCETESPSP